MNKNLLKMLTLLVSFFVLGLSCTEKPVEMPEDPDSMAYPLNSFSVKLGNSFYHATIDQETRTVRIPHIDRSYQISDVEYSLGENAVIEPDPKTFIGNWGKTETVKVTQNGTEYIYTIVLPFYEEGEGFGNLIFFDDFTGAQVDQEKWSLRDKGNSTHNKNQSSTWDQSYVDNGNLVLVGEKVNGQLVAGGIFTRDKFSFTYGTVEVKARMPQLPAGAFPAIWMMPQKAIYSGWPSCGEIDIMEHVNDEQAVWQSIHNNYYDNLHIDDPSHTVHPACNPAEWHVYGVTVTPDEIIFLLDGKKTHSYPNLELKDEASVKQWPWTKDSSWYIILNMAFGDGGWAGQPDPADEDIRAVMEIDWVRVKNLDEMEPQKPEPSNFVMGYLAVDDFQYDEMFGAIDWTGITHVIPSACRVKADGTLDTSHMDKRIEDIKKQARSHGVKMICSIMREKGQTQTFKAALQTPEGREKVADQVVAYALRHGFDGIDIDYEEYPVKPADWPFIYDFFDRLKKKADGRFILTSAVNAGDWMNYGKEWHTYFDYINVMSYGLGADDKTPRQHATFERYKKDIARCIGEYEVPEEKIMAGLPFYGFTWDSGEVKSIRYNAILSRYPEMNRKDLMENDVAGKTYYNGMNTIRQKCRYALEQQLGGVMIWQLLHDSRKPEEQLLGVVARTMSGK